GLRRLQLPSGHGHESRPEDFGLIRAGMHREGQRGDDDTDVLAPEPRRQKRGTEDRGEDDDDEWRNAPKEIDKHRERPREGPERRDSSPANCEADDGAQREDDPQVPEGEDNSVEERRQIQPPKSRIEEIESKHRLQDQDDEDRPDGHLGASNRGLRSADSQSGASRWDRDGRGPE